MVLLPLVAPGQTRVTRDQYSPEAVTPHPPGRVTAALVVTLTLDGNDPFVASTSSEPSYVTVAVGSAS
jgi:hypothetical protein